MPKQMQVDGRYLMMMVMVIRPGTRTIGQNSKLSRAGGSRTRMGRQLSELGTWNLKLETKRDADDREQKGATTTKFTFLSCRYMGQMDRSGNERRKGACERLCVCVTTPGAGDGDSDDEGV